MVMKPAKPIKLTISVIFLSLILLFLTLIFSAKPHAIYTHRIANHEIPRPKWLEYIVQETNHKNLKIGLVNVDKRIAEKNGLYHGTSELINVDFKQVEKNVKWKDIFPEWINETSPLKSQKCPEIPMPIYEDYEDLDVVVARVPCPVRASEKGFNDVFRLQINLVVANLLVKNGITTTIDGVFRDVYLVVISSCGPMIDFIRCDDLILHERNVRLYRPDMRRLKQKVLMPVGTCQLAPPFAQPGLEMWRRYAAEVKKEEEPREAYVTVLHSSESYICGAISLAQSIKQTGSTKDLVLLADNSITRESKQGLREAGWKIKLIKRIRSPHAKRNAYNKWNYSKFRIWQLIQYDKVIFIDSDILLLRNIDAFFVYPQLSAAENSRHIFNSGVMLIEPSNCTFQALMKERFKIISYNGGDQGFLNEVFQWWHRWPTKLNFLKLFDDSTTTEDWERVIPKDVYAIHYLGIKPWMCYRDYDCNWDAPEYRRFASDKAHEKWWKIYDTLPTNLKSFCGLTKEMDSEISNRRRKSRDSNSTDEHWKIDVKDPRNNFRKFVPSWM